MSRWKLLAFSALTVTLVSSLSVAPAQVAIDIGVAPVCPYGYFDYSPYACAPYGYYGPDWFTGGVFIGAGPWYGWGGGWGYGRGGWGYGRGYGRGAYGYGRGGYGYGRGGYGHAGYAGRGGYARGGA